MGHSDEGVHPDKREVATAGRRRSKTFPGKNGQLTIGSISELYRVGAGNEKSRSVMEAKSGGEGDWHYQDARSTIGVNLQRCC
jgi:hypothetical protein